jgi:hypothetical protein
MTNRLEDDLGLVDFDDLGLVDFDYADPFAELSVIPVEAFDYLEGVRYDL